MYKRNAHGLLKHFDFLIVDIVACELSFMFAFITEDDRKDYKAGDTWRRRNLNFS